MSLISIPYPLLRHYSVEQVNYCVMVGHEALLVLQLVEENVFAVDPDVPVPNLPIDSYLSLNLVFGIIFRDPEIRLAELAVAATSPHNLNKPVSRRRLNFRNVLQLQSEGNIDVLRNITRLDTVCNITHHMFVIANTN